ncbi:pentapeptide repeat-containing protein [Nostoc ellipsosporum NOK]|nr:pentapeptide repeat-containing protein [Nostoc ellipsosporum NOK]
MSANKTDKFPRSLIVITVIFAVVLTLIVFASSNTKGLSITQQMQYKNQAFIASAIVFFGLAVMANAYYAAKRTEAMQKNALAEILHWRLAAEKKIEMSLENAKLNQDRLVTERLMAAITQLGHERIEIRTSAIYVLERIAQDFPQEHWTIMEILTAFVRENAPVREQAQHREEDLLPKYLNKQRSKERLTQLPEINIHEPSPKIRRDIQAALTAIGRRNTLIEQESQKLDLRNTDMMRADLLGANFQRVDLRGCDLSGADLRSCDLSGADLEGARLIGTILYEAKLVKANLRGSKLCWANLNRANLSWATLRGANLFAASLRGANLQGANLYKANLQQATLKVANLSGAKLFLANLQGAKLAKANLHFSGLIGANLTGANLNAADLTGANLNAAKLHHTEVFFANLTEASFTEADLHKANLMGANLHRAVFYDADLSRANLIGANFSDANLRDVKLEGAVLTGAKNLELQQIKMALGDRTTRLPDYIEAPTHWRQSS